MCYKKNFLKNFAIFTGNRLCWSLFLIKLQALKHQHKCFPVKFAKFLRELIFKNICERLLLKKVWRLLRGFLRNFYNMQNITWKVHITKSQHKKWRIKNFLSKYYQIRSFLWLWSHLLKKSLLENFIFCAVSPTLERLLKNSFTVVLLNIMTVFFCKTILKNIQVMTW